MAERTGKIVLTQAESGKTLEITITQAACVNTAPVVHAMADKTIRLPQSFETLKADVTDLEGDSMTYQWKVVSSPKTVTFGTPNAKETSVTEMTSAGVYKFSITATDTAGNKGTDTVSITVEPKPDDYIFAGSDRTIKRPYNSVKITDSRYSPLRTPHVRWEKVSGGNYTISDPDPKIIHPTFVLDDLGKYVFKIIGSTSINGAEVESDTVELTVLAQDDFTPPEMSEIEIVGDFNTVGHVATAKITATDATPPIKYKWSISSGDTTGIFIGEVLGMTPEIQAMKAGTYTLKVVAEDAAHNKAERTKVITIKEAAQAVPDMKLTVEKTAENYQSTSGAQGIEGYFVSNQPINCTLAINNASDFTMTQEGVVATVKSGDPNNVVITKNSNTSYVVKFLAQGTYGIEWKLCNTQGACMTQSLTTNVDTKKTFSAGRDRTITLPTNTVTVDDSRVWYDGLMQPDTVINLNWTQQSGASTATISQKNTSYPTFSDLVEGTYVFEFQGIITAPFSENLGTDEMKVIVLPNPQQTSYPIKVIENVSCNQKTTGQEKLYYLSEEVNLGADLTGKTLYIDSNLTRKAGILDFVRLPYIEGDVPVENTIQGCETIPKSDSIITFSEHWTVNGLGKISKVSCRCEGGNTLQ